MYLYTIHAVDPERLAGVKAEMTVLGAPTLRAHWNGEAWDAIEGTHRTAAAHDLGLTPNLIPVDLDEEIDDHDCPDLPAVATVAQILDYFGTDGTRAAFFFDDLAAA